MKRLFPKSLMNYKRGYWQLLKNNDGRSKWSLLLHSKIVIPNTSIHPIDDYVRQFSKVCKIMNHQTDFFYIYPYDTMTSRVRPDDCERICSITVDFGKILRTDIRVLKERISSANDIEFKKRELSVIDTLEKLSLLYRKKLQKESSARSKELREYFPSILYRSPKTFDEAIQKILFFHALFWQMGHGHIGLGRLDYILYPYFKDDMEKGLLKECEAREMLFQMLKILGKDTHAKSMTLVGDTGQYILLGGVDEDGNNVDNTLTGLFIDLMKELQIPDPKLILRVNNSTSDAIWQKAVSCIMTGIGSPLIMNENLIMKKMVKYGYKKADVWNVGTSACWEPLIIGKSFDQNNPFRSAVAIRPLTQIIMNGKDYLTFEELYSDYKIGLKKEIESVVKDLKFDSSPLFSLFFDDCVLKEKDFTEGGAVYAYHGAQVVSLPNTINALLNIKRLVFEEKIVTLKDCRNAIASNYSGMEDFRILLTTTGEKFGSNNVETIYLTNDLMGFVGDVANNLKCNGNSIKIGFSSPSYIFSARNEPASLDGRKKGDPFAVHISPISSKIDISEILDFSSNLNYKENCINGNVVDFILPSSYIKQPNKLIGFLKDSCSKGLFELQLNVMDKAMLIDAKKHPEKYPNLIVRVWGFSAYFNDLPEEFKDNLIKRAEIYEVA